jgi:hypothetical protein
MATQAVPLEDADNVTSRANAIDGADLGGNEGLLSAERRGYEIERGDTGDPATLSDIASDFTVSSVTVLLCCKFLDNVSSCLNTLILVT